MRSETRRRAAKRNRAENLKGHLEGNLKGLPIIKKRRDKKKTVTATGLKQAELNATKAHIVGGEVRGRQKHNEGLRCRPGFKPRRFERTGIRRSAKSFDDSGVFAADPARFRSMRFGLATGYAQIARNVGESRWACLPGRMEQEQRREDRGRDCAAYRIADVARRGLERSSDYPEDHRAYQHDEGMPTLPARYTDSAVRQVGELSRWPAIVLQELHDRL